MILSCFCHHYCRYESGKMLYKTDERPTKVTQMPGIGNVMDWVAGESTEEMPSWAKDDSERLALRTTVETEESLHDLPRPVTPKAKEKLKFRTKKEIFGNKETQKWYIEHVKEALEKMDGDKLYDFIREHPKYGKGNHIVWNKDFAQLIGLNIDERYKARSEAMTHRRITAAAQHVLVDYYQNDVFQLTYTKKKINPWIFIDGKMGPYTVSVLNDYWMSKYGEKSTKNPKPPGRSGLDDDDYKPGSASAKSWDNALKHLDTQTGGTT